MKRHLSYLLQLIGIVLLAGVLGLIINSLVVGVAAISIYAIFAIWKRLASRQTFMLALIAFVATVLLLSLQGGESGLAANFVVYIYLLMIVGVITFGLEVYRDRER